MKLIQRSVLGLGSDMAGQMGCSRVMRIGEAKGT